MGTSAASGRRARPSFDGGRATFGSDVRQSRHYKCRRPGGRAGGCRESIFARQPGARQVGPASAATAAGEKSGANSAGSIELLVDRTGRAGQVEAGRRPAGHSRDHTRPACSLHKAGRLVWRRRRRRRTLGRSHARDESCRRRALMSSQPWRMGASLGARRASSMKTAAPRRRKGGPVEKRPTDRAINQIH
jgi:hypothetical protein